jgi:dsDNA-binding SOS-regulon protein
MKKFTSQCLIFFFIVQTLNLSINSLDFYTPLKVINTIHDDDYVDSMIEFLVENVMGYPKDTFSDKANPDNTSKIQHFTNHLDLKWFSNSVVISDLRESQSELAYFIPKNERIIILYYKEVRPKPPQSLAV